MTGISPGTGINVQKYSENGRKIQPRGVLWAGKVWN
jgi:hypothetical protein